MTVYFSPLKSPISGFGEGLDMDGFDGVASDADAGAGAIVAVVGNTLLMPSLVHVCIWSILPWKSSVLLRETG